MNTISGGTNPKFLEKLWADLLSRKPKQIQAAFDTLDHASRKAVLDHLKHMALDEGWQPEQRDSASAALQTIEERSKQE
jgi:hypothetical protein